MNKINFADNLKNSDKNFSKKKDFYKGLSKSILGTALLTTVIALPSYAFAAENVNVGVGEYHRFTARGQVTRVAVGNPEIADVTLLPSTNNEFLIIGKKTGTTSLLVWSNGIMDEYRIAVGADDIGTAKSIQDAIGLPNVQVRVTKQGDKVRVLLEGTVRDQAEHDRALKVASLYTGDKMEEPKHRGTDDDKFEYNTAYRANRTYQNIVDLLKIEAPTQIRIEAQIIEVANTDDDNWGLTYGSTTAGENAFNFGQDYTNAHVSNGHGSGFWLLDRFENVNAKLELLMKKGKAKILSRPNISTMSGAKAKIHIGGDIPYPKLDNNGQVSYEWKSYGIKLNIDPVVGENDDVTAEVHAEVSTPDYETGIQTSSITMPAIRSRDVHSVVHIDAGKTMVIGGLLNSSDTKSVKKVPILSSIPIIGEFFKHHSNDSEKRELVILLTPRVVSQETPAQMTDKMKEWYAENQYEANNRDDVDVNNPPLPEKVEKEMAKKAEEDRNAPTDKPGTRLYERIQADIRNGDKTESDYSKFENINTP